MIYQEDTGADNSGKLPSGGVLAPATVASSMSVVVANPIMFYGGSSYTVISQTGQSGDLYNYYWTSYSRGTDGRHDYGRNWHNLYLDSYIPLRHKSIYDPCPYGYRIPSNGTYNQFVNTGWTSSSYAGGTVWQQTWFIASGEYAGSYLLQGSRGGLWQGTAGATYQGYNLRFDYIKAVFPNGASWERNRSFSIRCIEE